MLTAWINKQVKLVSFHEIEEAEIYVSNEGTFWNYIFALVSSGYRLQ